MKFALAENNQKIVVILYKLILRPVVNSVHQKSEYLNLNVGKFAKQKLFIMTFSYSKFLYSAIKLF